MNYARLSKRHRKELLKKYSGYSLEGYCHLDDGTGDYARHIPKKKSDEKTRQIPQIFIYCNCDDEV